MEFTQFNKAKKVIQLNNDNITLDFELEEFRSDLKTIWLSSTYRDSVILHKIDQLQKAFDYNIYVSGSFVSYLERNISSHGDVDILVTKMSPTDLLSRISNFGFSSLRFDPNYMEPYANLNGISAIVKADFILDDKPIKFEFIFLENEDVVNFVNKFDLPFLRQILCLKYTPKDKHPFRMYAVCTKNYEHIDKFNWREYIRDIMYSKEWVNSPLRHKVIALQRLHKHLDSYFCRLNGGDSNINILDEFKTFFATECANLVLKIDTNKRL